jgi:hypothetical protein
MFPGAGAQVYYNDEGEPTGWDYSGYDEGPDPDDFDKPDDDDDEPDICDNCGAEFFLLGEYDEHARHCEPDGPQD